MTIYDSMDPKYCALVNHINPPFAYWKNHYIYKHKMNVYGYINDEFGIIDS